MKDIINSRTTGHTVVLLQSSCVRSQATDSQPLNILVDLKGNTELAKGDADMVSHVKFSMTTVDDSGNKTGHFTISAEFSLLFKLSSVADITEKDRDEFTKKHGFALAWPYWSEFVSSMVSRMKVPVMSIPVFNQDMIKRLTKTDLVDSDRKKPAKSRVSKAKKKKGSRTGPKAKKAK